MPEAYRGLVGAYRFAFTASSSVVFRSYVIVSGIVGAYTFILLILGLVAWLGNPVAFGERGLLVVIGLGVLVPLFGPVLIVARRYRRTESTGGADRLFGIAGYGFLLALALALAITDPTDHGPGVVANTIDSLPSLVGLVPLFVAVVVLVGVVYATR